MLAAAASDPTVRKDYRFFSQQPFHVLILNVFNFQDRIDKRVRGWDYGGAPEEQEAAGSHDEAVHGRRHWAGRDGLWHRAHGQKNSHNLYTHKYINTNT